MKSPNGMTRERKLSRWMVIMILFCFMLCSCKSTKPTRDTNFLPDGLYREVTNPDTINIAAIPWKLMFPDTVLQHLIDEGIQKNMDMQIASARIQQAEANFKQSGAALFPTLNIQATENAGKSVFARYQLGAVSSWEIDFWGKLRNARKANKMALLQSEAYKRSVQTQLVSDIVTTYYALLGLDAQLAITEQTLAIRKKDVETVKLLKESNVVTGAAVVQSEAARYSAEVTLPDLHRSIRETENSFSVLLGRTPGPIPRTTLDQQQANMDMKTGVPAQLLAYRPDVQQTEFQLRYATALVHAARAYFYPSLNITAQAGWTTNSLSELLNASTVIGNLVANLTQPIFNQDLNKQRLSLAKAREAEFLADFQHSLLVAGQEVSDALFKYQMANDKIYIRDRQIEYLQKAVDYTKELMRYTSGTNFTDVLTSEESLLAAQLNSVNDKLQQLQGIVSLYRSLGGGWK